jgi:hypothetical protein
MASLLKMKRKWDIYDGMCTYYMTMTTELETHIQGIMQLVYEHDN